MNAIGKASRSNKLRYLVTYNTLEGAWIAPLLASSSGISPSLHFARVDLAPLGHACYDIEKKGLLCDLICAKSATDRHAHTSTLIHIHTHIRRRAYKHEHKHNHARATD